jgi:carboxymethylenebutenolidase
VTLAAVEIDVPGATMAGMLAVPAGASPVPAVVLVHELFGLDAAIRDAATRLAGNGYAALAVDLFGHRGGRVICLMRELAGMVSGHGPASQVLADLEAAVEWLGHHPRSDPARTAMVGFCWGGGVTLAFATESAELRAAAAFYGRNPRPLDRVDSITCPVLAVYGEKDRFVTPGAAPLADAMAARGKRFEWHVVEGVGHSFMRHTSRNYRPEAGEEGWRLLLDFLGRELGPVLAVGGRGGRDEQQQTPGGRGVQRHERGEAGERRDQPDVA